MLSLCITSVFFGIGLAMDACAVSMTNGLNEPKMKVKKMFLVAFMYAFFQALMPMLGWAGVTFFVELFDKLLVVVPYVSLIVLCIIGGKMLCDGIKPTQEDATNNVLTFGVLIAQSVATSIDALATGFSLVDIAGTKVTLALISSAIIAVVTFALTIASLFIGKKFGDKLGNKAQILGGIVLIAIGVEIFVSGIIG